MGLLCQLSSQVAYELQLIYLLLRHSVVLPARDENLLELSHSGRFPTFRESYIAQFGLRGPGGSHIIFAPGLLD